MKTIIKTVISFLPAFILTCLFQSCGPKDRVFDNPSDPNKEPSKDSSTTSTTTSGSPGTPTGSETGSTGSTSSSVPGTTYSFSESFSVTPTGCSGSDRVAVFDQGSGLIIFVKANCGTRSHVYLVQTSYSGVTTASPTLITADCNSGATGVSSFSVDKGTNGFLLAYTCKVSSSSFTNSVIPIDLNGQAGTPVLYETITSDKEYFMAWNSSSSNYGLARLGQFQRFTESGTTIGGPITLSLYGEIKQIKEYEGTWFIVGRSGANRSSGFSIIVSSVNQTGTLECNYVGLGIEEHNGYDAYALFVDTSKSIYFSSYANGDSGDFYTSDFDPSTCKKSGDLSAASAVTNKGKPFELFDALQLNSTIGAILFTNKSSLLLGTYPRSGDFKIYAESSVAGYSTLTNASAKVIQKKIYAAYDKDGVGYVSFTSAEIPD